MLYTILYVNILNYLESGFRRSHGTTTTLNKISDDIRIRIDKKHLTVLSLLDFSNEFKNIHYEILLIINEC